ncbi:MAG: hypothetical protein H6810_00715 [Phycisphaeraceae bacterium]|nr:MAG: hypothetical protein H6810_00715 [Phycisphaeraceae bacterium]
MPSNTFRAAGVAALLSAAPAAAQVYVIAGPGPSLNTGSYSWATGEYLTDFRAALENPDYFGPSGVVTTDIATLDLDTVNVVTLSKVDAFISPFWFSADPAAVSAVQDFFLAGGDIILFNDTVAVDSIADGLGLPTVPGPNGTQQMTGTGFPFDGPFGTPDQVTFFGLWGTLDGHAIQITNGTILGRASTGHPTVAYWPAGAFEPDAGQMLIVTDIDSIATAGVADYDALNFNAAFGLNIIAHMAGANPGACNPSDLNGDGLLDLTDINEFIQNFLAGCP